MDMTAGTGKTRRNLVAELVGALGAEIADGTFRPGDKLPSEARLTERFGVSRTVVREAIAGLRADGLVAPRQGAGVFVLERPEEPEKPFHIVDYERISSVVEMLELRVAVEMEAAALAAQRRSPLQEEAIFDAAAEMRRCLESGASTKEADQRFHLAVADATNNPRFREFLEVLGLSMIPRAALAGGDQRGDPAYIDMIAGEHESIASAVSVGDSAAARDAMQAHLRNSMSRYRELIRR
ncbi:HTH-type transcriptional regulator LutR [Roseivivax jejudonensis]|uniref:HTH-type transcriptional regulator LutR n=1 Tax=Roseivivax jejudonensis TaxID=1529041 RepID=A0A1X6Y4I5_9RHOB|nr:FadR/GntR family transcriptional regulator [Roseivivax jejudonensis]SLN10141.1 HTH-type transcriptional regulator LutR [Roseivivax jejudonensis]